jgi:hypothetical protein
MNIDIDNELHKQFQQYHRLRLGDSIICINFIIYIV